MENTYWHKQESNNPIFSDLVWSKPANKLHAGKLLIIGGNSHGFSAPAEAFSEAIKAGIGSCHVLLPDSLAKIVGRILETASFAPSTPSGSFAKLALAELLDNSTWADGVLLAGDLGRNSETAILLESFITKYSGQLTITKDSADYFTANPSSLLKRQSSTLVISFAQLQKLASHAKYSTALTFSMDLMHIVDWLHEFSQKYPINIVTKHLEITFVAVNGQVSTTKTNTDLEESWRVPTASQSSVWWIQNPSKPFQALTTAVSEIH